MGVQRQVWARCLFQIQPNKQNPLGHHPSGSNHQQHQKGTGPTTFSTCTAPSTTLSRAFLITD
ncbi:hypothetical protein GBA52_010887 [Prunus armeniaca]|nr:hypothetical protein GBA52_010887 [Prunus armeniaca]